MIIVYNTTIPEVSFDTCRFVLISRYIRNRKTVCCQSKQADVISKCDTCLVLSTDSDRNLSLLQLKGCFMNTYASHLHEKM